MKAIAFPLVMMLAAGVAAANEPNRMASKSAKSTAGTTATAEKATKAKGEVVSAEGDTLVLKTSSGDETFTASGKTATELKNLHAGERVVVKTRNNELVSVKAEKSKKTAKHAA
jgi:hypothetical protein